MKKEMVVFGCEKTKWHNNIFSFVFGNKSDITIVCGGGQRVLSGKRWSKV